MRGGCVVLSLGVASGARCLRPACSHPAWMRSNPAFTSQRRIASGTLLESGFRLVYVVDAPVRDSARKPRLRMPAA